MLLCKSPKEDIQRMKARAVCRLDMLIIHSYASFIPALHLQVRVKDYEIMP